MASNGGPRENKDGVSFKLANAQGHGMKVMGYGGIYHWPMYEFMLKGRDQVEMLKGLKDAQLDKDDVIICAYPKCGTHWVWEMIEMLKSGALKHQTEGKETRMIEFIFREGTEAIQVPRFLNTHLPLRMLPRDVERKKIKVFHIMRNPKDTCVSYFNHYSKVPKEEQYDGDFTEFTEAYLKGEVHWSSYHEYLLMFEKESKEMPDIPVLSLYYENMKKDPVGAVKEMAKFMDLSVSDKFCEEVAEECSFKKMKKMDTENRQKELFQLWEEGSGGSFYRKGEIGDWKNWFTVAESERFDHIWNEKMKGSGMEFTYS